LKSGTSLAALDNSVVHTGVKSAKNFQYIFTWPNIFRLYADTWVRKQHSPFIAHPLMEVDVTIRGFGFEIREFIADIHFLFRRFWLSSTEFIDVQAGIESCDLKAPSSY
jgi:hypothetical protein